MESNLGNLQTDPLKNEVFLVGSLKKVETHAKRVFR